MNTLSQIQSQATQPDQIFDKPDRNFREFYNQKSFLFRHRLVGHPLFELPRLVTLAEALLREEEPESVYFDRAKASAEK